MEGLLGAGIDEVAGNVHGRLAVFHRQAIGLARLVSNVVSCLKSDLIELVDAGSREQIDTALLGQRDFVAVDIVHSDRAAALSPRRP